MLGWARDEAQAGEIDAATGTVARLRRAELALAREDPDHGCPLVARVRVLWRGADVALAPLRARADSLARACP